MVISINKKCTRIFGGQFETNSSQVTFNFYLLNKRYRKNAAVSFLRSFRQILI